MACSERPVEPLAGHPTAPSDDIPHGALVFSSLAVDADITPCCSIC
jgi:hypothetical protein